MTTTSLHSLLRERFAIVFRDPALLDLALTHASKRQHTNNERLEFLGDRVLGLVLATHLYVTYPDESEGDLARRHAALVRADMLAEIARTIQLGDALHVASGGDSPAQLDNVIADALEALIGALYLDQGFQPARDFILTLWQQALANMGEPPQDPKTGLQEWAQARGLPLPAYDLVDRSGPDHAPNFTICVRVENTGTATATGPSRRIAEKAAAQALLDQIGSQS